MMARHVLMVLFMVMIATCGSASAQDVATRLAALDYDYRTKLEDLLRTATQQDEKAVVALIKTRLAVVTPKPESAVSAQSSQSKKTLKIVATVDESAELYCSKKGIQWKNSAGNRPVDDITVNGVAWAPVFGGGASGRFTSDEVLPMNVGTVLRWKTSGLVKSTKLDRGPGLVGFLIRIKDNEHRPATFTLDIEYQPAPVVEGSKQESGEWQN